MITLETLYPELFSEICKYLDNLSIIRFHQCSRYLYQNVKITDISMDLIINDEIIGRYQNLKFLSSPYNSKFEYLPKVNLQYLHVFIISQEELDAFIEQFNKISMPALTSLIISWNPDESHS